MIATHEESWRAVEAHTKAEIEKLRDALERHPLSDADTSFLRGKIAALRGVLALAETESSWTPTAPVDYMKM
ncbi:hypothetical protein [Sphingobium yanoikuyae]|uniref:hypothetical protein n=1 Tax=Sphingobium yanoikuyae TaxID=13690 RepID=UPI0035C76660